jgi:hypothetical protein
MLDAWIGKFNATSLFRLGWRALMLGHFHFIILGMAAA